MEFRMACPKCLAGIYEEFNLVGNGQVLVTVRCINKSCKWCSSYTMDYSYLANEEPTLARKILRQHTIVKVTC